MAEVARTQTQPAASYIHRQQCRHPSVPARHPDSPSHCRAILACSRFSTLVSIDLVSSGSVFDRIPDITTVPKRFPEFRTTFLTHHQDVNEKSRKFRLDDKHASHYGFRRCAAYPRELMGDAVTLSSLTGDLTVVVYANGDAGSRFAVGLGYHYGQEWVHVDYDLGSPTEEIWMDFGERAYHRMWEARAKHARDVAEHEDARYRQYFMKNAHLPHSIWAVRVVWGTWEADHFKVMVDVVECPGCCDGPYRTTTTVNDCYGLIMPGLMKTVSCSYELDLDQKVAWVDDCSGQQFALGDYGDYSHGDLVRIGNIFEDMRAAGMDREHLIDFPPAFRISGSTHMAWMENQDDLVFAGSCIGEEYLALHQPRAFSLPANEHVSLLLKALSTRLAGKHLVTAIIQCSDFYTVDEDGKRRDSGDDRAPSGSHHSTEAGILTPLCVIASPQVWRIERCCEQSMERFRSIREHFDAMADMVYYFMTFGVRLKYCSYHSQHQQIGNEQYDKSAVRSITTWRTQAPPYNGTRIERRKIWRLSSFQTCSVSGIWRIISAR
ncbi:hypothetical protein EDD15DRAFT_1888279 [Pisolithus albus]|nr:hypothetical protein EDD15DRAFT_1888279 [Pisolithus albus]